MGNEENSKDTEVNVLINIYHKKYFLYIIDIQKLHIEKGRKFSLLLIIWYLNRY